MVVNTFTDISLDTDLVLLDLDNTLYDYFICHDLALQQVFKVWQENTRLGVELFNSELDKSKMNVKKRHYGKAVSHSRMFYFQGIVESLLKKTDTKLILELYSAYWDTFIDSMVLFEDVQSFLSGCKEKGVPVIIVTDMTSVIQFRKVIRLDIGNYIKYIVTSEEFGQEKPDEGIFTYAIDKMNGEGKAIHHVSLIGDEPKKDYYHSDQYAVSNIIVLRN